MRKGVFLMAALFFTYYSALSSQPDTTKLRFFVGINPIAPFTSIPNQWTNLYLPLVSNLENGLAVSGGYLINERSNAELRVSAGSPNSLYHLYQLHIGYTYILSGKAKRKSTGFYGGAFLKYYTLHNTETSLDYRNLMPYLCIGYQFDFKPFFFDVRLNQNVYAISWSDRTDSYATGNFYFTTYQGFSPVLS